MFQHRHYVKMAAIIAAMPEDMRGVTAMHFADQLRGSNPAYDAGRFISAALGKPSNGRDRA